MWCWWPICYDGDIKWPGAKFNKLLTIFKQILGDLRTNIIRQNVMLVKDIWCWCVTLDFGDVTCYQHPNLATNAFGNLGDFSTGTDELSEMARWIFEIIISSDYSSKAMYNNMSFLKNLLSSDFGGHFWAYIQRFWIKKK